MEYKSSLETTRKRASVSNKLDNKIPKKAKLKYTEGSKLTIKGSIDPHSQSSDCVSAGKNNELFVCQKCGKTAKTKQALERHAAYHEDDRPFACEMCHQRFKNSDDRGKHYRRLKKDGKFKHACTSCHKHFKSDILLSKHQVMFGCQALVSDDVSKNSPKTDHEELQEELTVQKDFPDVHEDHDVKPVMTCRCKFCETDFESPKLLKSHYENIHNDLKRQVCIQCGQTLSSRDSLNRHYNIFHQQELLYPCTKCDQKFKIKESLYRHIKFVHTDGGYPCSICQHVFSQPVNLRKHMNTHNCQRECVCEICGKTFKSKQSLEKHSGVHTDINNKSRSEVDGEGVTNGTIVSPSKSSCARRELEGDEDDQHNEVSLEKDSEVVEIVKRIQKHENFSKDKFNEDCSTDKTIRSSGHIDLPRKDHLPKSVTHEIKHSLSFESIEQDSKDEGLDIGHQEGRTMIRYKDSLNKFEIEGVPVQTSQSIHENTFDTANTLTRLSMNHLPFSKQNEVSTNKSRRGLYQEVNVDRIIQEHNSNKPPIQTRCINETDNSSMELDKDGLKYINETYVHNDMVTEESHIIVDEIIEEGANNRKDRKQNEDYNVDGLRSFELRDGNKLHMNESHDKVILSTEPIHKTQTKLDDTNETLVNEIESNDEFEATGLTCEISNSFDESHNSHSQQKHLSVGNTEASDSVNIYDRNSSEHVESYQPNIQDAMTCHGQSDSSTSPPSYIRTYVTNEDNGHIDCQGNNAMNTDYNNKHFFKPSYLPFIMSTSSEKNQRTKGTDGSSLDLSGKNESETLDPGSKNESAIPNHEPALSSPTHLRSMKNPFIIQNRCSKLSRDESYNESRLRVQMGDSESALNLSLRETTRKAPKRKLELPPGLHTGKFSLIKHMLSLQKEDDFDKSLFDNPLYNKPVQIHDFKKMVEMHKISDDTNMEEYDLSGKQNIPLHWLCFRNTKMKNAAHRQHKHDTTDDATHDSFSNCAVNLTGKHGNTSVSDVNSTHKTDEMKDAESDRIEQMHGTSVARYIESEDISDKRTKGNNEAYDHDGFRDSAMSNQHIDMAGCRGIMNPRSGSDIDMHDIYDDIFTGRNNTGKQNMFGSSHYSMSKISSRVENIPSFSRENSLAVDLVSSNQGHQHNVFGKSHFNISSMNTVPQRSDNSTSITTSNASANQMLTGYVNHQVQQNTVSHNVYKSSSQKPRNFNRSMSTDVFTDVADSPLKCVPNSVRSRSSSSSETNTDVTSERWHPYKAMKTLVSQNKILEEQRGGHVHRKSNLSIFSNPLDMTQKHHGSESESFNAVSTKQHKHNYTHSDMNTNCAPPRNSNQATSSEMTANYRRLSSTLGLQSAAASWAGPVDTLTYSHNRSHETQHLHYKNMFPTPVRSDDAKYYHLGGHVSNAINHSMGQASKEQLANSRVPYGSVSFAHNLFAQNQICNSDMTCSKPGSHSNPRSSNTDVHVYRERQGASPQGLSFHTDNNVSHRDNDTSYNTYVRNRSSAGHALVPDTFNLSAADNFLNG